MIFGTKTQVKKIILCTIRVGAEDIKAKSAVRNLGSHFDIKLKMTTHDSHDLKIGYFHIRQISIIQKFLTLDATKTLVHAMILSRIDYANALLFGIPEIQLNRLQRLQNKAARLITQGSKHVDSKTVLPKLH